MVELVESFYEFTCFARQQAIITGSEWHAQHDVLKDLDSTSGKLDYAIYNFTFTADLGDDVEDCMTWKFRGELAWRGWLQK